MNVTYIKNAFALGGIIAFVCILALFFRRNDMEERIQGTWRAIYLQVEY